MPDEPKSHEVTIPVDDPFLRDVEPEERERRRQALEQARDEA